MKRTLSTPLIALALFGLVIGFLLEISAASAGVPIIVPPVSLPITLVAIGVIVVLLAWPIRQATNGPTTGSTRSSTTSSARPPVNPFVAMRVAVLAKASSLSGALLLGAGFGVMLYILTRSVVPAVASLWLAIATVLGAAVLMAGGLVAEHFCTLPPDDDNDQPGEVRA